VIWLQNHGIFVAATTIAEVQSIYSEILHKLEQAVIYAVTLRRKRYLPLYRRNLAGSSDDAVWQRIENADGKEK
jgi:hypothetical protein